MKSRRKHNRRTLEKRTAAKSQTEIRHDLRGYQEAITRDIAYNKIYREGVDCSRARDHIYG